MKIFWKQLYANPTFGAHFKNLVTRLQNYKIKYACERIRIRYKIKLSKRQNIEKSINPLPQIGGLEVYSKQLGERLN